MGRMMGSESISVRWLDDVVYAIKEFKADAAIFAGHQGCKQTWSVFSIVRNEILKRTGIPVLGLQGDSWIRTATPITAIQKDIEQFIDIIVVKQSRGKAKA
jgi:benzoyl-CoA reductase/2-hydroxyglutaryl-CoA dehydratase subunit BcrC/BadD/HgdB